MKITEITPIVLEEKLSPEHCFSYSQARCDKRVAMILRVRTDEGIIGWGESFGPAMGNKTIIGQCYAPELLGQAPMQTEVL